jgi:hypothetical protein
VLLVVEFGGFFSYINHCGACAAVFLYINFLIIYRPPEYPGLS